MQDLEKVGYEIELVAPRGATRRDLAQRLARTFAAGVQQDFVFQSELMQDPDEPVFSSLTIGHRVVSAGGQEFAACVDDITLNKDLDREAAPASGYYRILSDDVRLLELVKQVCRPDEPATHVLQPLAVLYGTPLDQLEDKMSKVVDRSGRSVAMAVTQPGERERACEIVTAPITSAHAKVLAALFHDAEAMQFRPAVEGATHIHVNGVGLQTPHFVLNALCYFDYFGQALRERFQTNPECVRIGTYKRELVDFAVDPASRAQSFAQLAGQVAKLGLTKYCDFNLLNLFDSRRKCTFELRVLPAVLDVDFLMAATALTQRILQRLRAGAVFSQRRLDDTCGSIDELLEDLERFEYPQRGVKRRSQRRPSRAAIS